MKKKIFSLMALLALGASFAWAETTTLYERGYETDWSAADIATSGNYKWGGNAYLHETLLFPYADGTGTRTAPMTIQPSENVILTIDAVWYTGGDGSEATNYTYFKIGEHLEFQAHTTSQVGNVVINGNSSTVANACGKNNGNRTDDYWTIHAVINTATGELSALTVAGQNGNSKASYSLSSPVTLEADTYSKLTFGTVRNKYSPYCGIKALKIVEETQNVSTYDYTVNYLEEEVTVKSVSAKSPAGVVVNADESFFEGGQKYFAKDGETMSMTISATDENILNVAVRKAGEYHYSVKASCGNTLVENTGIEGEKVTAPYARYVDLDGTLYSATKQSTNPWWGKSITLTQDNQVETIAYTASNIDNVVYFSETENIAGATKVNTANTDVRCSMMAAGFYEGELTTLQPGKYTLTTSLWGGKDVHIVFKAGETIVLDGVTTGSIVDLTSEEFTVLVPTVVTIEGGSGSSSSPKVADFVYIRKTGEATITKTLGTTGVATFSAEVPVTVPEGITVYGAKVDGDAIVATSVEGLTVIPANTGVLIKGDASQTYTFEVAAEAGSVLESDLYAVGAPCEADVRYGLLKNELKFAKLNEGVQLAPNSAFVGISGAVLAPSLRVVMQDSEANGIDAIHASEKVSTRKVVKNGQICIESAEGTYNVAGVRIK